MLVDILSTPAYEITSNRPLRFSTYHKCLRAQIWLVGIYFTRPWAGILVRHVLQGDLWIIAMRDCHEHVFITCDEPLIWIDSVSRSDCCHYVNENRAILIQPIAATIEALRAKHIMTIS